jgi:hypothetical protein
MSSNSAMLDEEFSCVTAFVPTGWMGMDDMCVDDGEFADDDEQPGLTAATSLSLVAEMANAGFVRDDAILFVVAITDEDEEMLGTDAATIAQTLVDAKGGTDRPWPRPISPRSPRSSRRSGAGCFGICATATSRLRSPPASPSSTRPATSSIRQSRSPTRYIEEFHRRAMPFSGPLPSDSRHR